ncbi:MAG: heme ABC transporter ATP-binding protein [Microbacteriaceae bacterium]|nr:heme ABC transporter ATP-binding protein [Microbacteriaceae bacterium]
MAKFVPPQPLQAGEVACAARNITVKAGDSVLLRDISLELRAGEVLALLGPNGAGKSTLLGVLSGEISPVNGDVEFAGKPLGAWSLKELARRRGVLLQEHQLMFPFSALEVIEMGRAPWLHTPLMSEDDEAITAAAHSADVAHLTDRRVPSLSGGERARVSLARILAGRTSVVMLDEPTAALDLKHQEATLQCARDLALQGAAVLVVLHDLTLAAAYSSRIALLKDGELVASGAPAEVLTGETLSAVYDTPIEVLPHPRTGAPLVLPSR